MDAGRLADEGGGSSDATAISCCNSADLDFSGLAGSFQRLVSKRACFEFTFFVALMGCPMSRCCAV